MCGKPGCLECGGKPGHLHPLGNRNAELTGYTDQDTGPGTTGKQVQPLTEAGVNAFFNAMQARYARMLSDKVYDASHPVDEYAPQFPYENLTASTLPLLGTTLVLNVPTDYDMPERYESVGVLIPAGALTVTLQLGQRAFYLRSALSATDPGQQQPAWMNLSFTGIILNTNDNRILTVTYVTQATTGSTISPTYPLISLTGFALTKGQYS